MTKLEETQIYVSSCIGWMSPDGEIVSCRSWEHTDKAEEILDHMNIMEEEYKSRPDEYLWTLGWIKIYVVRFFGNGLRFASRCIATEKQRLKIREMWDKIPEYIDKGAGLELQASGAVTREELTEKGFKCF